MTLLLQPQSIYQPLCQFRTDHASGTTKFWGENIFEPESSCPAHERDGSANYIPEIHPESEADTYTPVVIEDHPRTCCSPPRAGDDDVSRTARPTSERTRPGTAAPGRARVVVLPPDGAADAEFLMGTEDAVADPADLEGPVRRVSVARFAIATTAVTNADFDRFVEETGHVTTAERFGDSLVFAGRITSDRPHLVVATAPWWRVVPGACWRHPEGPDSNLDGRDDHPVVHVSHLDATAYCEWIGGRLPTEEEWEFAARGGLVQRHFPWGDEFEPGGVPAMNVFEGSFPYGPTTSVGTVPVDAFAPNGYGLFNTTGNVWEWTASPFSPADPRPVLRGGSYLCHASYCRRYRTSARIANTADTSTGHSGFRIAYR